MAYHVLSIVFLVLGFGFVVFFHELGHFLAAKWVGIKVEQFAVGFGQALFSYRKGMGWCVGSSRKKYEDLLEAEKAAVQRVDIQTLGETEYRLNWVPLGGYVKMLGQDDLKPGAGADDPRAYNRKSIGARMVVVSAGVIMNVILAAIGFMIVFLIGFKAPPATVGAVYPNSPAQKGGIQVGDAILYIDNKWQYDFSKVGLTTALLHENEDATFVVARPGMTGTQTVFIRPERMDKDPHSFLSIGIQSGKTVQGLPLDLEKDFKTLTGGNVEAETLRPGEVITAINGQAVGENDYYKLDQAIQASNGQPVPITILGTDKKLRQASVRPHFERLFGGTPVNFGGLQPRVEVESLIPGSTAIDKLKPGDDIVGATVTDLKENPTEQQFLDLVHAARDQDKEITVDVLRDGKPIRVANLSPTAKLEPSGHGLGVGLVYDENHVVTGEPLKGSAADRAGVPTGALVTAIDGQPVMNWFDVRHLLGDDGPDKSRPGEHTLTVAGAPVAGHDKAYVLALAPDEVQVLHNMRYFDFLQVKDQEVIRKTSNPVEAAMWGVGETRDFILQFYVTIARMFQGSVSVGNMMGPVGIVAAGSHFAYAGPDKLIWFLAMISANLAVVNFLPIPIVDGGLFTFLIVEKIQGRPLSGRAQVAWQIVGLALIVSVFLLVTYGDIHRMLQ